MLHLAEWVIASRLERGADEGDGSREIAEHELRADVDDAEACALQLAIAASISAQLARVNGAIDLDDELDAWSQEISDEEPGDRGLRTQIQIEKSIHVQPRASSLARLRVRACAFELAPAS